MSQSDSVHQHRSEEGLQGNQPSRPMGLLDRLAKRGVIHHLNQLTRGRVTLEDRFTHSSHGSYEHARDALIRVHDPRMYRSAVLGGGLGFAEAYLEALWDSPDLTGLLRVFARDVQIAHKNDRGLARLKSPLLRAGSYIKRNTRIGSRRNIAAHYDLGNEFFSLMLDETMTYSCGIFPSPITSMQQASINKLDRICQKLGLQPGDHVLETGTGWGSFAIHAAKNYGCRVTTTTISARQHDIARKRIEEAGLSDKVTLLLKDYRDLEGQYDKLVSIEMIEAVGHGYLDTYMGACANLLKPDGQMLLQVISMPDQRYKAYLRTTDFIQKHVFPGSCCPALGAVAKSVTRATDFRCVQYEDMTPHYVTTLGHWQQSFDEQIDQIRALGYPERFIRLWNYYLAYCRAGFAERYIGVGQMLLNKPDCRETTPLPALRPIKSSKINEACAC